MEDLNTSKYQIPDVVFGDECGRGVFGQSVVLGVLF